ncbi:tripartite tricarboxylate transporter substrate-binding protein [Curvibacter sp. RS43]|uniref:tripartite tricarboxylate transporter substrate-binding protein n=1 Tax=Curvibacter microcysteis TaxID=3026419 RepID=UPI0023610D83|nr:tripartite tricarboxylate transporter substrate-binding protein [Curvibacter sp. RS43]MDD0812955.1 tripartite tricarboxylate transporter substrate-binding protein [Curvibacter sp. RS43]
MLTRRHFNLIGTALAGSALTGAGLATQTHLPVAKIISGFPPGGTLDVIARRVADKLRGPYAGSVLVDNRPGAAGQIGVLALKDSPADGSSLLITPSSMLSIYPYTYPRLRYTLEDVSAVSLAAHMDHGLAVGPAVPESITTLKDFLAWVATHPDAANFGSPGAGSMPHLVGILLNQLTRTDLRHIAYRGTVPGVQDLLGGQISAFWGPIGDYLQYQKVGKLRVLAVAAPARSVFLPQVPTLRELGFPLNVREWYGFFLPGKVSAEVQRRAAEAIGQALAQPDVVEAGRTYGLEIKASTPSALNQMLQADAQQWRQLIRQAGFTAES